MDNPATAPITGYAGLASTETQTYWLDVAWRALQGEDRTLVPNLDAGLVDAATVADVVTAAARRVLRNPDGVKQEAGGIDTWTESRSYGDATEDLYFTAAELRRITPSAQAATGFAGSLPYIR